MTNICSPISAPQLLKLALLLLASSAVSACIPSMGGDSQSKHVLPVDRGVATQETSSPSEAAAPADTVAAVPDDSTDTAQASQIIVPVVASAVQVAASSYTVKPGDTLRGIGNRTGAGSEMIARENNLAQPYVIKPGQKLSIPAGRYHLVEPGQTGLAIAQAYGVSWAEIIAINGLSEPFYLRNGQRLKLPDAPAKQLTLEQRAAAFRLDIDGAMSGSSPAASQIPESTSSSPLPPQNAHGPAMAPPGRYLWPARGTLVGRFGPAADGVKNNGIDISVPVGTAVRAAAAGKVTFASNNVSVFGGLILVDHGSGWISAYGYVSKINVTVGASVKAGQTIALSGDSGLGKQPKLHFELRHNRQPVDPLPRLAAN